MNQLYKKYLIDTYLYTEQEADKLLDYVDKMYVKNKKALKNWAEGKGMKSGEAEGITVKKLYDVFHFNPIVCYVVFDWLEKKPEQASFFLSTYHERPTPLITQEDKDKLRKKLDACNIRILDACEEGDGKTNDDI